MKALAYISVLALAALLIFSVSCPAAQSFIDTDFYDYHWTMSHYFTGGSGGVVLFAGQVEGGVDSTGYCRKTTSEVNYPTSPDDYPRVSGFYFRPDWTYDPSTQGPIESIDIAFDLNSLCVGIGLAIKQSGRMYYSAYGTEYRGYWVSTSNIQYPALSGYTGLKASGFLAASQDGPQTPDFSVGGAPITFGYVAGNSTAWGNNGYVRSAYIDNLNIKINQQALPVVGISTRSAFDTIMTDASDRYSFKVWGTVKSVDGAEFTIDDGSGISLTVSAPGHVALAEGDMVQAKGQLDCNATPRTLRCSGNDVSKLK